MREHWCVENTYNTNDSRAMNKSERRAGGVMCGSGPVPCPSALLTAAVPPALCSYFCLAPANASVSFINRSSSTACGNIFSTDLKRRGGGSGHVGAGLSMFDLSVFMCTLSVCLHVNAVGMVKPPDASVKSNVSIYSHL